MFTNINIVLLFLAIGALGDEVERNSTEFFKFAIRETCKLNNVEDKAPQAEAAFDSFYNCFTTLIDFPMARREFHNAKANGELKNFFHTYCGKAQEMKSCMSSLFGGVYPCLSAAVRNDVTADDAATAEYIDHVCHNDGERAIAYFTGGASDYLKEQDGNIIECLGELRKGIVEDDIKLVNIYGFCGRLLDVIRCSLKSLEGSRFADAFHQAQSMFTFLTNHTFCKDQKH